MSTTSEKNKEVVQTMWTALSQFDFEGLKSCLHPDIHYEDVSTEDTGAIGPDDCGFLAEMTAQGFPAEGFSFKRGAGCLNVCDPSIGPIGLALEDLDPMAVAFTGFFAAVEIQVVGEIARIVRTAKSPREASHQSAQHKGFTDDLQPLKPLRFMFAHRDSPRLQSMRPKD